MSKTHHDSKPCSVENRPPRSSHGLTWWWQAIHGLLRPRQTVAHKRLISVRV